LLEATGQQSLADDPRFSERLQRIKHQDELIEIFTPIFKQESRDVWCERLLAQEVPHSPAYEANEALEDPQAKHLQLAVPTEHPQMGRSTTVRAPYSFDGVPELEVVPPPTLDEHGAEIRSELQRRKVG
jgi:crotonobetainyl-CoA:carnitine CoA-transferase CaiB-like acyl-CoA transferase